MSDLNSGESATEICAVKSNTTVLFAAEELARRLGRITGRETAVREGDFDGESSCLYVGAMSAFPALAQPDVEDPAADDAIFIDVAGERGIIAGINARSVLLAVYRYLTELGCRWVRPGADGESLPRLESLPAVKVEETASHRHRGVCIEGAVSYEHVRDMVDWLPKLGFNAYFIQFREAHTFFDRWYSHAGRNAGTVPSEGVPDRDGTVPALRQALSQEKTREYTAGIEREIAKRGLLYHKVGHGWTCEPFGISGLGWEKENAGPGPDVAHYLAEVDGERKLWGGVALNTNLCYSNPEVRRIMVDAIASYAQDNPHVRFLHVWLADGSNNNCECAECRKARPSDFYVTMLNELDAVLTEKGLDTRIVFLIYVDLLWPPEEIGKPFFSNPSRFVLMFAPIVRTYSETFRAGSDLPELPPYIRNKLKFLSNVDANVAFLKAWQEGFEGDSFDFDYHLMWDHVNDPGHMQISQTIALDMKGLKDIGLNGFVSCQVNRMFFPTGLAMTVMGRTLWNAGLGFDEIATDYFASAFGPDAQACLEYLTALSGLFDPPFMRGEKDDREEAAGKLARVQGVIAKFRPVIERNLALPDTCQAQSWFYLNHHADLTAGLARALLAKTSGENSQAAAIWKDVKEMAWQKEPDLHPVFDAWLFTRRLDGRFK